MFHTIEHEFGHILHQNVLYPQEWKAISTGIILQTEQYNRFIGTYEKGFITTYAQSNPDDDFFVEMISMMLTEGKGGYEGILNTSPVQRVKASCARKRRW